MKHSNLFIGILSYIIAGIIFMAKRYYVIGADYESQYDWVNYFVWLFIITGIVFLFRWVYMIMKGRDEVK